MPKPNRKLRDEVRAEVVFLLQRMMSGHEEARCGLQGIRARMNLFLPG
jgi:hypothetical protein